MSHQPLRHRRDRSLPAHPSPIAPNSAFIDPNPALVNLRDTLVHRCIRLPSTSTTPDEWEVVDRDELLARVYWPRNPLVRCRRLCLDGGLDDRLAVQTRRDLDLGVRGTPAKGYCVAWCFVAGLVQFRPPRWCLGGHVVAVVADKLLDHHELELKDVLSQTPVILGE